MPLEFQRMDTTPPSVTVPVPPPDSTVGRNPVISARFADAGAGIDTSSARILLDGRDRTRQAKVTSEGFTLRPQNPLERGVHRVEVTVSDRAGNQSNRLSWRFGVDIPVPVTARFDKGMFLVNDAPFFPMGIYNYSCNPGGSMFDEFVLAQVTAAGYNCLLYNEGSSESLEILQKHGMKALLRVNRGLEASTDLHKAKEALVDKGPVRWKEHPALLAYWADSPDAVFYHAKYSREDSLRRMTLGYQTLRENDLTHPAIWCFAHRDTFKDYIGTSDALMTFFYPIGQADFTVSSVSDIMIRPAMEAATTKQVWFISQAIDLTLDREGKKPAPADFRPTPAQMRAMNYLALVEGVKGLIIYASGGSSKPGVYNNLVEYPAQWQEALKMAGEVRYLSPVLAVGKPARTVNLEPEEVKKAIRFRELVHHRHHYLIAVNVTETPVSVNWRFAQPVQPIVLFEDRRWVEKAVAMPDTFQPYEVHIYRW
ncbi:MAG TPA: Ig-like domain-containing protein [Chthonomonadales bacterium]|nr:Ig-like domain-containing protein [Chthonomonadales bacterium]